MVNFELVLKMISTISEGEVFLGTSFNEFCIKFYLETKALPLSKFLKLRGFSNKTPKIMNTRKAGELLFESKNNKEILELLNNHGYESIPELNYSAIMVLRKSTLEKNWIKLISYLKGDGTIDKIIKENKRLLLPEEREKIVEHLQNELNISSTELEWLSSKMKKIYNDKKLFNSINKLF